MLLFWVDVSKRTSRVINNVMQFGLVWMVCDMRHSLDMMLFIINLDPISVQHFYCITSIKLKRQQILVKKK